MRNFRVLRSLVAFASLAALPSCGEEGVDDLDSLGASMTFQPEVEPNGVLASATPIVGTNVVLLGNVFPNADADLYSFTGLAGDRVYAATQTAFSASSNTDSVITILASDGVTVIETDDQDGTFGLSAANIAGAILPTDGTYYIRVTNFSLTAALRPYHLHFQLWSGAPAAEAAEPNDAVPQPLPAGGGWVSGSLASAADVDLFSITVGAGDTISAMLDLDPERDAVEWNGTLGIGVFSATAAYVSANDAGNAGPDSEAVFVTVKSAGTYFVRVTAAAATFGTYHVSVSVHPAASGAGCFTYTSSVPVVIPAGPGLTTATLDVPDSIIIGDVDVALTLTHTSMQDLDVELVAPPPASNTIGLFTDIGALAFPDMDVVLDDEAALPISSATVVSGMVSEPELNYRLSWLDGQQAQGTWSLEIRDDAAANSGTLLSWGLTICPAPAAPVCPAGTMPATVFSTDFESGAAGFTHSGVADEWNIGLPSLAPFTTCASGTSCFKTDLTAFYNASCSQDLFSPAISLAGISGPIRVTWNQKYQIESANFDHASVDVRNVGGANPTRLFEFLDATMTNSVGSPAVTLQETAGWALHAADITAYAGTDVELVFHLDSDTSVQLGGMAIDDVTVTGCVPLAAVCGDGVVSGGELCDDSNLVNGDGCDSNCTPTGCGNGVVTMGETCDDGNAVDGDGCDANCTPTACGNGVITAPETCDDSNLTDGDGCDSNCTVTACGNGVVTAGEACDDGNGASGDGCDSNCTATACGNAVITAGELCDDGNTSSGDGCSGDCLSDESCGNGIVDVAEQCDDGNLTNGDGCESNCTTTPPPSCGDGTVNPGEACDDGNTVGGDGCSANCLSDETCGNGIADPGEACDDGNLTNGDG